MKTANGKVTVTGRLNLARLEGRDEGAQSYPDGLSVRADCLVAKSAEPELEQQRLRQEANDKVCAALNRFHDEHGSFAAEHSTL